MALLCFYFDLTSKQLVAGPNDSQVVSLPMLYQEDGLNLDLYIVERANWYAAPFFAAKSIANLSLFLSVGSANSILASQNVFTSDSVNNKFTGTLPLNTAGIDALADGASSTLEIRLLDSASGAYYRGQFQVTVKKSVALAAATTSPVTAPSLSTLEAAATYVPYELPAGRGLTFVTAAGQKWMLFPTDDGPPQWLQVT